MSLHCPFIFLLLLMVFGPSRHSSADENIGFQEAGQLLLLSLLKTGNLSAKKYRLTRLFILKSKTHTTPS
jgi:hypothetical protein